MGSYLQQKGVIELRDVLGDKPLGGPSWAKNEGCSTSVFAQYVVAVCFLMRFQIVTLN